MNRDKTIDRLRGFAMLWVILIHALYWGEFFTNTHVNLLKSYLLFEMPLFFYVTGASSRYSNTTEYFHFLFRRFKRFMIPYWVFSAICVALTISYHAIYNTMNLSTAIQTLLSWILPFDTQISSLSYLTWALWFIPVYLCVLTLIPLLKKAAATHPVRYFIILACIFMIVCLCRTGWIQNIAFYGLWTYIGLFHKEIALAAKSKEHQKYFILSAIASSSGMILTFLCGASLDIQYHKFPPNITFALYSIAALSVILLFLPQFNHLFDFWEKNILMRRILDLFSTRSLTIYLYQGFAFNLAMRLVRRLAPRSGFLAPYIQCLFCFAVTVLICAVFAIVLGWVEDFGKQKKPNS